MYDSLTANFADALVVLILVGLFPIASANTGPLFIFTMLPLPQLLVKASFGAVKICGSS